MPDHSIDGTAMELKFRKLHPLYAAEASGVELKDAHDPAVLEQIRAGMDEYAVLVFRNQRLDLAEQLAFTERFDGKIHRATSASAVSKNRHGDDAYGDISNVDERGTVMDPNDRRRMNNMGNRLWHTDASFVDPCGRYSLLAAKVVPPVGAETEFTDTRAAHDALDEDWRRSLQDLKVFHSIVHSRSTLGFEFSEQERQRLPGAVQPLIRTISGSGRKSLHLASHASHVVGWPVPEGRLLLLELMEHATQQQFIYRHRWQEFDVVIWDNRATMHRATRFDDKLHRRELVRTTTIDLPRETVAA
jgi:alpha-ketoglutarate-dependent 2,4-dichlorophenoxyacetate dioxygenase